MNHKEAVDMALSLAKGAYQVAIIRGEARLSGADLKGTARKWGRAYARSRRALLARLRAAGMPIDERIADHGRRVLLIAGVDAGS